MVSSSVSRAQAPVGPGGGSGARGGAGPYAWLLQVASEGPGAGAPLLEWLAERSGWARALPLEHRQDVLQTVGLTLLERAARIVEQLRARHGALAGRDADRLVTAYVSTMVRHRVIDWHRRPGARSLDNVSVGTRPALELYVDARAVQAVVQRAWARARRERPVLASAFDQLEALTFGEVTMARLVDREQGEGEGFTRVRDRLLRRHARVRAAVKAELLRMWRRGEISSDRRDAAVEWVDRLLCRRVAARPTAHPRTSVREVGGPRSSSHEEV